jgi:hypothetical protein
VATDSRDDLRPTAAKGQPFSTWLLAGEGADLLVQGRDA